MRGLFITGTDTGVGKTVATALIARALRADGCRTGCYKPVCSGSEPGPDGSPHWADIEALSSALGDEFPKDRICPQAFHAPLAPPSAARLEGRDVDGELMRQGAAWWREQVDVLLVEGVGGLLCPISARELVADLAVDLGFPVLVVSPLVLGTINHTLLTIEAAARRGLTVSGILFNDMGGAADVAEASQSEIAARSDVRILGTIPYLPLSEPNRLRAPSTGASIDWLSITGSMSPPASRSA